MALITSECVPFRYGDQEAQLFLATYDTVRNNQYGIFDDEFAHSHVSTAKADLQGQERAGLEEIGQMADYLPERFQGFDRAGTSTAAVRPLSRVVALRSVAIPMATC